MRSKRQCAARPARAGGTGGHLFPAEALRRRAGKARRRRRAGDRRARRAISSFRRAPSISFRARRLRGRNPFALARTGALLALGSAKAWALIGRIRPSVVVGFGGYPTVPPLFAASLRAVPTRAARAERRDGPRQPAAGAARHGHRHRLSVTLANLEPRLQGKVTFTGNPVRPLVIEAANVPYRRAGAERTFPRAGLRRQPGRARHGRDRAGGGRAHEAEICARGCSIVQQARAEDVDARARDLCAARRCRRMRAVLCRPAGPHGGRASRRLALRRFDRGRACRHRPAGDPGAAAACARSGPVRQCRRAGGRRAGRCASSSAISRPSGWPPKSPRLAADPGRLARMAQARQIGRHHRRRRAAGRSGRKSGSVNYFGVTGLVPAIRVLH